LHELHKTIEILPAADHILAGRILPIKMMKEYYAKSIWPEDEKSE
jgi:hypothetical protein